MGNIEKGHIGQLIVKETLLNLEYNIFSPELENGKVDLIIEKNNEYLKIQIKTVQIIRGYKQIPVRKVSHNMGNYKIKHYTREDIDYFIGVDVDTRDVYMIPIKIIEQYKNIISVSKVQEYKL